MYRNPGEMICELIDCVSKNGAYLLNVAPRADGILPREQRLLLNQMGAWLRMNGEAIYGTRPWVIASEGPTEEPPTRDRGIVNGMLRVYTAQDMRFTRKGDDLYAILFAWPSDDHAVIRSLATGAEVDGDVNSVAMLGSTRPIEFSRVAEGLHVTLPVWKPCEYAHVLKITGLHLD